MATGNKSGSKGASKGPTSNNRPREAPKGSMTKNASGQKTYTDTKTGKTSSAPKYGGASVKGLTSKDPGNVARNRAGAAKYSSMSQRMAASNRDGNADKAAAMAASRAGRPAAPTMAPKTTMATAAAAPKPSMMATKPPAGYRPGIDPEYNYRAGAPGAATTPMAPRPAMAAMTAPVARVKPTITLAKGGSAKGKKK